MTISKLIAMTAILASAQGAMASDPTQFNMTTESNLNIGVGTDAVSIMISYPVFAGICRIEVSKDGIKSEMENISQKLIIEGAGDGGVNYEALTTSVDENGVMSIDLSGFRYSHVARVRIRTRDGQSIAQNTTHSPPMHELPLIATPGLCNEDLVQRVLPRNLKADKSEQIKVEGQGEFGGNGVLGPCDDPGHAGYYGFAMEAAMADAAARCPSQKVYQVANFPDDYKLSAGCKNGYKTAVAKAIFTCQN